MIHLLNSFILANILIIVGTGLATALYFVSKKTSFRSQLRFNYLLLFGIATTVVVSGAVPVVPQVVVIKGAHSLQLGVEIKEAAPILQISTQTATPVKNYTALLTLVLVTIVLLYLGRELYKLGKVFYRAHRYKRFGSVRVFFSEDVVTPFSMWVPGRRLVVIPYAMASSSYVRLCAAHELQHHRQRDTQWVYILVAARVLFFMNPAIHFWHRLINEIQEFSCDEVLLGRKSVSREKYIGCLVEVAENSLRRKCAMDCAAVGVAFVGGQNLKRRIQYMLQEKKKTQRWLSLAVVVAAIAMSATAFAAKNMVKERVISAESIRKMAGDKFVIDNEAAFQELSLILNDIANDPIKRKFLREGMERYKLLKPDLDKMAEELGANENVLAVGLIESGYQNFPPHGGDIQRSTGMWQMIASTAKRLGLRVDSSVDERRDTTRATDAALRYLVMNRALFDSWDLSVLAYNAGEKAVEGAIQKTGSRNPWVVKKALPTESQKYYVKWLAALLILQNPEIVQD